MQHIYINIYMEPKSSSAEFRELLRDIRQVFSEDNINLTPEDVDVLIADTDNDMWGVIESEGNDEHRVRKRALEHVKRQRLFLERKENLKTLADHHIGELEQFVNAGAEETLERVADLKKLHEDVTEVINEDLSSSS